MRRRSPPESGTSASFRSVEPPEYRQVVNLKDTRPSETLSRPFARPRDPYHAHRANTGPACSSGMIMMRGTMMAAWKPPPFTKLLGLKVLQHSPDRTEA